MLQWYAAGGKDATALMLLMFGLAQRLKANLSFEITSVDHASHPSCSWLQEHNKRAAALAGNATALLPALFNLAQRLEEVESKVRVLQLVSVAIEALGDAAGPLLGSVAAALPMVGSLGTIGTYMISILIFFERPMSHTLVRIIPTYLL